LVRTLPCLLAAVLVAFAGCGPPRGQGASVAVFNDGTQALIARFEGGPLAVEFVVPARGGGHAFDTTTAKDIEIVVLDFSCRVLGRTYFSNMGRIMIEIDADGAPGDVPRYDPPGAQPGWDGRQLASIEQCRSGPTPGG
jgi:hypothetical protein